LWVDKELAGEIEGFIRKHLDVNPNLGGLFNDVARRAIRFALSKPDQFKDFLDKTAR